MTAEPENIYKIQNVEGATPANLDAVRKRVYATNESLSAFEKLEESYLSWQDARNKDWLPSNGQEIFSYIKYRRELHNSPSPVKDQSGIFYGLDDRRQAQFLHEIDLEMGGTFLGISGFNESDGRQFIRRNLIEESIASSKLEGANTSRDAARKMLAEGRRPRDKGERMIFNNHAALASIENDLKREMLSLALLKQLHRQVTQGTLASPEMEGELRNTFDSRGKRLKVMPWDETTVAYVTPDREFVDQELPKLIEFANDAGSPGRFIHPLVKAILLHFWIGLLHPFEDGNGRLARILFYWYMLRKGYWAFSYLSLSEKIIKSPKQYAMAYIYSEQDGYDLNYFIQYNVEKLKLARRDFQDYITRKIAENRQTQVLIDSGMNFNRRQLRLLRHLAGDESRYTNVSEYHNVNSDVGYLTAVTDLKRLVEDGYLAKRRVGRNVYYRPTPKVRTLIK
jgi:Fic family protein